MSGRLQATMTLAAPAPDEGLEKADRVTWERAHKVSRQRQEVVVIAAASVITKVGERWSKKANGCGWVGVL